MKKILLVSNKVFHYRIKIYNYMRKLFAGEGYDFLVLTDKMQRVDYTVEFECHEVPFGIKKYCSLIDEIKPDIVILFLHLKDYIMLPVIRHCKKHGIKVIYWNHGINIKTPDNVFKNFIFHYVHGLCDGLITYSEEMRKNFKKESQEKLFVANNALNLIDINKDDFAEKQQIKDKFGIKEEKAILYISRFLPYKKPDVLMKLFKGEQDIALVFVGPGILDEQKKIIDHNPNMYYLGEKYGKDVHEIYKIGDIYSTPGHIGLSICDAFFWGLPVVLLNEIHSPEICYFTDGKTGYLANNENELKEKIVYLLNNQKEYEKMSKECLKVYQEKMNVENMYQGFLKAVRYVENK